MSRSRKAGAALASALAWALAGGAAIAAPADPHHGEQLARHWCAACHIIADDQTHGTDNAPTFAAIAAMPGFSAGRLAHFLADPHPKMPDMQLSRTETADLAAYIASLRK